MQSFNEEGGDIFFDACDNVRTSISSSEDSIFENEELELRNFEHQPWTIELTSVRERRERFLQEMGFYEFSSSSSSDHSQDQDEATDDGGKEHIDLVRIMEDSGAVLNSSPSADDRVRTDSLPSPEDSEHRDSVCSIRDLDRGRKFIVYDLGKDGLSSMLREDGSDKLMTLQEFEALLGLSCSPPKVMQRDATSFGEKPDDVLDAKKKKFKSWWRSFSNGRYAAGMCKSDVSVKNPKMRSMRTRVQQCKKRSMEFTALYMGQEIEAHRGLIRTMKFSPSGCYLASGGEDCVVRIWQIREVEASCRCFTAEGSSTIVDKVKDIKPRFRKCDNSAPVIIPKKIFKIEEAPIQEFYGHTGDILDLSWSKSDCLLTSSKDKTVRMWKVGCSDCLKVFQHTDYVTCVQFNPIDDKYFISGSIDGKVRIWGVQESRVVDWVDLRDIITAICYQPDGKGFVVGCITGNCRFYNCSGQSMQLDSELCIQGKKKSSRITSLQFSLGDPGRVMITAADAKIRIVDGFGVIHKFKGLRRARSQFSASFTSDGRYIVSVGADSHVYIWNYDSPGSLSSKGPKSIRACELFLSEGASVAVPWPGLDSRQAGLSDNDLDAGSLLQKILEASTCLRDPDCFSLGAWLFSDGSSSRGSATWPEEKLSSTPVSPLQSESCRRRRRHHLHHHYHFLTSMAATWSLVIVTASHSGTIRCFHNYGLPVRL